MHRLIILASVVMLAASSVNCANSPERSNGNVLAPSASDGAGIVDGGHGGGNPGKGADSGDSLTLVMVTDKNGDGLPNFGDTVTFAVHTTATAYPWVTVKCIQNGTLVGQGTVGIFATSVGRNFTLGPTSLWRSGTASCSATLENWDSYSRNGKITVLASTSFPVGG